MIVIPEWNQMLFLACPIMNDLSNLMWSGLFVNELSMHDYSRYPFDFFPPKCHLLKIGSIDTGQVFNFKSAQCSLFLACLKVKIPDF